MLVKLEWLGYRMVKTTWRYVKPFSSGTGTSRTDGRMDGRRDRFAISISRVSMLTRDKNGAIGSGNIRMLTGGHTVPVGMIFLEPSTTENRHRDRSFSALCSDLVSYNWCCQCNRRWLSTISSDGRILFTTAVDWGHVEQEAVFDGKAWINNTLT